MEKLPTEELVGSVLNTGWLQKSRTDNKPVGR
jgi:hypothetical protein